MRDLIQNIEALSNAIGTSGDESAVRKLIFDEVISYPCCLAKTDNAGNLIVTKKGKTAPKNKIMLTASMDEVGFIVTEIDEKGFLKFSCIGDIDTRVMLDKRVIVGEGNVGILGSKAIHLVKKDEFDKPTKIKDLYIDIGADSKEEAEKLVSPGDRAVFDSEYTTFGDGLLMGRALDARVGVATLLELLKDEAEYDFSVCFTVKGELDGIGAANAAFGILPDIAVSVGYSAAGDMPSSSKTVCKLGEGTVVSYRDKFTLYDMSLYREVNKIAEENGIKVQIKQGVYGKNNAAAFHKAVGGIKPVSVEIPVRYTHSPYSVLKISDCEETVKLVKLLSKKLCEI